MDFQDLQRAAMAKVTAVDEYLKQRLLGKVWYECGSDLQTSIDLYLPDRSGDYGDVEIPLGDVHLLNEALNAQSAELIEELLRERGL